jgi:hypothetical protein
MRRARRPGAGRGPEPGGSRGGRYVEDPLTGTLAELRRVQPAAATKAYLCPGCNHEIAPGVGHVVVVPLADAPARRHWHSSCWERRARLPPHP